MCCLGLELAVFRSEAGEAAILDAYCPHLGANLAAGGHVEGNHPIIALQLFFFMDL